MVKTLHMFSILTLISAGFVFAVFIACGSRADPHAEQILASSVIERYRQAGGNGTQDDRHQTSPLVQQAQAFALYLNPPSPPKRNLTASLPEKQGIITPVPEVRPPSSSPKFELRGISYYRSRPAESMALVWEPGSGHRWVKQGTQLGHFFVEQVNSRSILYRDGQRTHEMALELGETLATFARSRNIKPASEPTERPQQTVPGPPPVRGVRQMPPARVAARINLRELDIERQ
jgi:hypothetical protein